MARLAFLIIVFVLPLGCATPFMAAPPETEKWAEPAKGAEVIVHVGDPLLAVGEAQQMRAIIVPSSLSVGGYSLAAGEYLIDGMREDGTYRAALAPRDTKASTMHSILSHSLTGAAPAVPTVLEWKARADRDPELCVGGSCTKNPRATLEWIDVKSFERRLIYNGRSGNMLRAEYREFRDDLARPAYSTELIFDLGKSRVIGVKGSRIEVLGVNNRAIKFRVLKSFSAEQQVGRKSRRRAVAVPASPRP